jgi:uncharacterized membrane protein YkvA (DUF1232 family)
MAQPEKPSGPTPSVTPSDQELKAALENPAAQAAASKPEVESRLQREFEMRAASLKDRLGAAWEDLRDAYRMSFDQGFTVQPKVRTALLVALVYLILPIDVIPDPIPVVGIADDVALIVFAMRYAAPEIARYRQYRAGKGDPNA